MSDLISRQAVIDVLAAMQGRCTSKTALMQNSKIWQQIKDLPSAEPKKGKWIKISPANIYECSVCHQNVMTKDIEEYHYCHHCGADMRESE